MVRACFDEETIARHGTSGLACKALIKSGEKLTGLSLFVIQLPSLEQFARLLMRIPCEDVLCAGRGRF